MIHSYVEIQLAKQSKTMWWVLGIKKSKSKLENTSSWTKQKTVWVFSSTNTWKKVLPDKSKLPQSNILVKNLQEGLRITFSPMLLANLCLLLIQNYHKKDFFIESLHKIK